jgi:hypothetical protein
VGSWASVSGASEVSAITSPTLTTLITPPRGTFQANLTPDSTLQALVPTNICLKDLIGLETPPQTDDNQPICLSFHMKQGCWSNCKRIATHARQLSNAEKQRVANFALAQMAKRTVATATPTPP